MADLFSSMLHLLIYSSLLLAPFLLLLYILKRPSPRVLVPPGPKPLPIIGNLHQLSHLPHRSFFHLSKNYGPLMLLKLGRVQTLIASSPDIASQILKTNDISLCSRPPLVAFKKLSYGGLDIAFAPYGEQWKQVRRLSNSELFSLKRVQSFRAIREEEVEVFAKTIANSMSLGESVNLSEMAVCLFNNITFRELFGRRVSEEGECRRSRCHDLVMEIAELMGGLEISFLGWSGWIGSVG